ncbi:uncharacterized protein [Setaria viridis]|uniref:uncharacterized protein n=1 Tax=Setaria viridis TaxID=4556 RepID=UPI00149397C5|nr:uncharacterized protein LOC117835287 [Setaria viridis]
MARDVPLVVQGVISATEPSSNLAHFLLPRAERGRLPAPPSPPCNVRPIRHGELQVEFKGWPVAPDLWKVWVDKLRARHEPLWRDAGILHAILATTCWVGRDDGTLLQLAAFWSGDTNTFVFPWGEATVTLEDVAVLAGLPLRGEPVCKKLYGSARGDVDALEDVRSSLCQSSWNAKPSHAAWAKHFSELPPEDEFEVLEHEGFLAMWLSLFVLPVPPSDEVRPEVLPVAARLARGGTVALAPAALASIYADLSALRRHVVSSGERQPFAAWAPLDTLQLWVWERFPELRPEEAARSTPPRDAPRAVRRWHDAHKVFDPRYVHAVLMSPAKFEWAPYGSSGFAPPPGSYGRRAIARRTELLLFAHCLRACEMVGMNSIEQYRPHRVARQLGFDQDVPGAVARANSNQFAAWATYKIGLVKFSFIVPSNEPAVTAEYEQWWEPCSRACATAVAEAARMKVSILTQIAGDVNGMMPGWVRNAEKRSTLRRGKKVSQGSSGAAATLLSAVDEPSASVAEKERSKSLQQQSQEEAPQPVTMPDEQNSEQAQVLAHHLVKQTQFGATTSSLLKPSEERRPVSTGNNEPAAALEDLTLQQEPADGVAAVRTNAGLLPGPTEETRTRAVTVEMGNGEISSSDPVLEVDRVQKYCVSDLAAALKNIVLQQEPADPLAAVTTDAGLLQEPTEETRTRAVTVEMGNGEISSSDPVLEHIHRVSELAAALKNITLQQKPADTVATVRTDADLLQEPTDETRTRAVTSEMSKRALKGKFSSLEGNNKGTNNNVSSPNQQMECAESNKKSSGNGGTSSSRLAGENTAPDSTEVCTKTLYYLRRSDRTEDAWANDANRNADFFHPKQAVGTMEMMEKASAIRQAESSKLRETIMKQMEEIRALEAAEKQERRNLKK